MALCANKYIIQIHIFADGAGFLKLLTIFIDLSFFSLQGTDTHPSFGKGKSFSQPP